MPATNSNPKDLSIQRQLLIVQFGTYRRIVERKHGIHVPLSNDAAEELSDEDLLAYIDSLKDMAHLPPG